MAETLTKDEKKAIRQTEWREKEKKDKQKAMLKKYSIWSLTVGFIFLAIAGLMWLVSQPTSQTPTQANVAPVSEKDIATGPTNAPITLIEYADFQCPACSLYHPIVSQLLEEYKDKINYVYRTFPLTNIHKNAVLSSKAAYAAHKQGAFFKYDDYLYDKQDDWSNLSDPTETFLDYAKSLKLDMNKFKADLNSEDTKKFVEEAEKQALNEGINATPTFIINGNKITNPGSLEEFKKVIDNELNK